MSTSTDQSEHEAADLKSLHTWQTQSTLDAGEEEATLTHSTNTICPPTPVNELSLENQTKDATTPVLPVPLSPPPLSPKSKAFDVVPPSQRQQQLEDSPEHQTETRHFSKRPRSYRDLSRHRRAGLKKNYGTVIGDFNGLYRDELTIRVGEKIEIISKDTLVSRNIGWWTGRDDRGKIGIFPAACVSMEGSASHGDTGAAAEGRETSNGEYSLGIHSKDVEMKEVVGIGGFGKVYRAIYQGEEVAVKVAKTTTFDSLKAVQEVISEAEKFAHLAHNNVCALVGVVLVKDVCLVMEYARGGALSELLHKKGVSLPINIILDWALQIADGMNYLHNIAQPSLIHRDLKSSNILLSTEVDPDNLEDNCIKITDFGLAREIEHTTHMSGAGTYPWMAPEVIRSSDFSKKSDVWSFGVVLWELLTGKRPYDGLNLFVVAYGVGHGTLNLPIPDGCPSPLTTLLNACWDRVHSNRPTFMDILHHLKTFRAEELFSASNEEFRTMQSSWRLAIQEKFNNLKRVEQELQSKERSLQQRILEQEKKEKQLDREKEVVKIQAERLEMLIKQLSQQQSLDEEGAAEETDSSQAGTNDTHTHQQDITVQRPPRLKPFSIRGLIKRLWNDRTGAKGRKVEGPLPNKVGTSKPKTTKRMMSSPGASSRQGNPPVERREKRSNTTSLATPDAPTFGTLPTDKRASLPNVSQPQHERAISMMRGHRRLGSDDLKSVRMEQLLAVDTRTDTLYHRGSCPSSPRTKHQTLPYPSPQHQPIIHRTSLQHPTSTLLRDKQRSWSDLRSPSPQKLLPSFISPPPSKFSVSPGAGTSQQHQPLFTVGSSNLPLHRPGGLDGLKQPKLPSHTHHDVGSNSPGSPNVTVTPAEDGVNRQLGLQLQYDSGKDSMTCSDHSNGSESQPDLIKLDAEQQHQLKVSGSVGGGGGGYHFAEFDPLMTITQSVSNDSLFESQTKLVSPMPIPCSSAHQGPQQWGGVVGQMPALQRHGSGSSATSTSPKSFTQVSPKQSLSTTTSGIMPSLSIARPRPKAMNLPPVPAPPLPISAPSSRPHSPKPSKVTRRNTSPTPSVESMRTYRYDSDPGWNNYLSDSDATSTSSSLLDVRYEDGDTNPVMVPSYDFENFFNPIAAAFLHHPQ